MDGPNAPVSLTGDFDVAEHRLGDRQGTEDRRLRPAVAGHLLEQSLAVSRT